MFLRLTTSTLALAALTAPSFALTPEELWANWTNYYASTGHVVSEGSRDLAGETLTLRDVTLKQEGEADETVTMTLPEIVMTGTGDGGVRSTFGPGMTIVMQGRDSDDRPVTMNASITLEGAEVVSTGDAAEHVDRLTAPTLVAKIDSIDQPEGEADLTDVASLTLTDLTGTSAYKDGGRTVSSESRAEKGEYRVNVADDDGRLEASGSFDGLEAAGDFVMPSEGRMDFGRQMSAAIRAGAALSARMTIGANSHKADFSTTDEEGAAQTGNLSVSAEGGELTFKLDEAGLGYQGAVSGLDTNVTSSGMPMPVAYRIAESTFDIQMPVLKSDASQPFKFAYSLSGVVLDEAIWAMFDPAKKLPRDPAELDIDATGQVRLSADLFDPAQMQALEGATDDESADAPAEEAITPDAPAEGATPADDGADAAEADAAGADDSDPSPFEITELTLNQFALSGAGVKVEADGAMTVPAGKSMTEAVGSGKARVEGANRLIDTLVGMGLLGQEDVMGYRMMLTMFTKPGEGEDVLTSEVEMKEGGELLVNGQRIK